MQGEDNKDAQVYIYASQRHFYTCLGGISPNLGCQGVLELGVQGRHGLRPEGLRRNIYEITSAPGGFYRPDLRVIFSWKTRISMRPLAISVEIPYSPLTCRVGFNSTCVFPKISLRLPPNLSWRDIFNLHIYLPVIPLRAV
jgi:hypothetical protein